MISIYENIFFFLFRAYFFIKMFLHYIIDNYHMQDRRTNLTTIMINICFLLFIPWRTFAYGMFIFMWPWKEADHSSKYISWIIITFLLNTRKWMFMLFYLSSSRTRPKNNLMKMIMLLTRMLKITKLMLKWQTYIIKEGKLCRFAL